MTQFIDAHVHPPVPAFLDGPLAPYRAGLSSHLGRPIPSMTPRELASFYRDRDARAVLLGWDTETSTNLRPFGTADVAELVAGAPDVFVGFGALDPLKGALAVAQVHEAARLGLAGVATHASAQGGGPGVRGAFAVWEAVAEYGLVCLFHTGITRLGAGLPGGGGIGLAVARPLPIDEVAATFPDLDVLIAHTGTVWFDETVAIALHKRNVHLCLSGQDPATMDGAVLDAVAGPLADRVHFGSDFPFGSPDGWLAAWRSLDLPDDLTRRVLHDNTARLLGA